jgi:hypothetical protein
MRKSTVRVLLRYLIIGVILPFFVQYVIYFRFTSNYMVNAFSERSFTSFYGKNVFQYRVLGKSLHLWVYHKLEESGKLEGLKASPVYGKRLTALDPEADNTFYLTYFIIATLFTMFAALALLYLFDSGLFEMSHIKKVFITANVILLIGFFEFVVTPYDNITYFFLILNSLLFLKFQQTRNWGLFVLLNLSIVLSTLNHESALLSLSFIAAVYFSHYGSDFRWLRLMVIPALCYLLTWIALRLFINDSGPGVVAEGLKLWRNLNILNVAGMMGFFFAIITFYFMLNIADSPGNKKMIWNFLLMASPYILMVPVIGIMVEARLWMPVIIGGVILSQLRLAAIKFPAFTKQEKSAEYGVTSQP